MVLEGSDLDLNETDMNVSEPAKLTNTQEKHMQKTSDMSQNTKTQETSNQESYQILTYLQQVFPAKRSVSQGSFSDSKKPEVHSFLKSLGLHGKRNHNFCSLKTLGTSSHMTKDGHSERSLIHWMKLGMTRNGFSLTLNFSFLKTGNESILSDILETDVDQKYFLSEQATQSILKHATKRKSEQKSVSSKQTDIASFGDSELVQMSNLNSNTINRVQKRDKSWCLTGNSNDQGVVERKRLIGGSQGMRVYSTEGTSTTITAQGGGQGAKTGLYAVGKERKIKRVDGKPNVYKTDAQAGKIYEVDGISPSVTGQRINSQGFIAIEDKRKMKKIGGYSQCGSAYSADGIYPTVSACTHGYANPHIVDPSVKPVLTPGRKKKMQNGRRIKDDGEEAFTITSNEQNGVMFDDMRIRRLTPKECERLQGFPDDFSKGVSDTQRYKQMGNAVTVPVVEFVSSYFPK